MRFGHPPNSTRTVTRFLLFPKWLEGEGRWLERATWIERWTHCSVLDTWTWVAESWKRQ